MLYFVSFAAFVLFIVIVRHTYSNYRTWVNTYNMLNYVEWDTTHRYLYHVTNTYTGAVIPTSRHTILPWVLERRGMVRMGMLHLALNPEHRGPVVVDLRGVDDRVTA